MLKLVLTAMSSPSAVAAAIMGELVIVAEVSSVARLGSKLVLTITGIIYSDYRLTGDTSTDQVEWSRMECTVYMYCTNAVSK